VYQQYRGTYVRVRTNLTLFQKRLEIQALNRCNGETRGRTYIRTMVPLGTTRTIGTMVHVYVPWYPVAPDECLYFSF
jgi:hypothetical protein